MVRIVTPWLYRAVAETLGAGHHAFELIIEPG